MANFENITIEKGMYQAKGGLSGALERLDPSENYTGTCLEGLDAFSRQLKRFDIRVSGRGSDCVEKFFQTSNSAALFPEYVSRAVRQGMERADILPNLVATVTDIEGMDYRSVVSDAAEDDKSLKVVGEGAVIPQTTVRTRENLVKLHKRGRMLVASYEALRFQRLDLFTVTLSQIGAYIARAQLRRQRADGRRARLCRPAGALGTADALRAEHHFGAHAGDAAAARAAAASGRQRRARLSGQRQDDKLIDRQLERAAITCTAGFAKIFTEAAKTLS